MTQFNLIFPSHHLIHFFYVKHETPRNLNKYKKPLSYIYICCALETQLICTLPVVSRNSLQHLKITCDVYFLTLRVLKWHLSPMWIVLTVPAFLVTCVALQFGLLMVM